MSPSAIIFNDVFNSACYCAGPALCIISRICLNKSDLKTGPTSVASDIPGVCSDPGADFRHRHGARSLILDTADTGHVASPGTEIEWREKVWWVTVGSHDASPSFWLVTSSFWLVTPIFWWVTTSFWWVTDGSKDASPHEARVSSRDFLRTNWKLMNCSGKNMWRRIDILATEFRKIAPTKCNFCWIRSTVVVVALNTSL